MTKSKHGIWTLVLAIIGIVFISGCVQQSPQSPVCPTCPSSGAWSECSDEGIKSRTLYRCGADTNYACESYIENKTCVTEITLKSGSIEAVISPTADETVKGIIKVEATKVPSGTTVVAFIFVPQGMFGEQFKPDAPNVLVVRDIQAADGWKALLDTTKVANGIYTIFVGASYEGAPDANPWLDQTSTQVVVRN